jgi:hypothetical protein
VAVYTVFGIAHVARDDLGFSLEEIRGAALLTAAGIATLIAIDFLGKKLGNAK